MIRLLSFLLALTLAATSVPAAVMQSEMQGSHQMVICADTDAASGLTQITLDATGKPVDGAHSCPDCTAALGHALLPEPVQTRAPASSATPVLPGTLCHTASRSAPSQTARGPPPFA